MEVMLDNFVGLYAPVQLTHIHENASGYLYLRHVFRNILGEVLSLPRFMVASSLKPISYLIWE